MSNDDALIIYQAVRRPEKKVFYIRTDVNQDKLKTVWRELKESFGNPELQELKIQELKRLARRMVHDHKPKVLIC